MLRPLTQELEDKESPVRRFLDSRFSSGLREAQRRYRSDAPPLVVPSANRQEANPGTAGTAADWLPRLMVFPRPCLAYPLQGAALCGRGSSMAEALIEIASSLGYARGDMANARTTDFAGPVGGNDAAPEYLARACRALALLTEMFRNPMAAMNGPLGQFRYRAASADSLLAMASPAALGQLAVFRSVYEEILLLPLLRRPGRWIVGPEFPGLGLMKADADLIVSGLLLDLKTDSRFSLGVSVLFQVIGYALLDFDDEYSIG